MFGKKALEIYGDSSSEKEEIECSNYASMVVVQDEENEFDGLVSFMAKSDDEDKDKQVTVFEIKRNLNTYSFRRLKNLANVLIDTIKVLITEKDAMNNYIDSLNEDKGMMMV